MAKKKNPLNIIQLVLEVLVVCSYLFGLVPLIYLIVGFGIVPMLIANLIIAIITGNKTTSYVIVNLVMAVLSFIPIIGYIPRIIGAILSILNIIELSKRI